ncbi:outer membrane beta-barrel protein [Alistipes sp.]|uniref:outer membrane beta-barrel protein n=1 Tax=Alistipes sp. TaxID=1872444 RepID=UPI003AF09D59
MKRRRSIRWFSLLCALTLATGAGAQQVVFVQGHSETLFRGRIVDSLTREPLPAAVISLVSKNSFDQTTVRNFVTDTLGYFRFECPAGPHNRIEATFLGYRPKTVYLATDEPERNLGDIPMAQSVEKIDEVVVRARLQMYRMKGDTTIYLPRAVNTMKDDKMIEILRHMPGVEVTEDGNVTILGQPVERTYVNQKLLFGEDPAVAIRQLEAREVASIEAYDEVDEADAVKHGKNARKRKVLNVVTFKKFAKSLTAKGLVAAGSDLRRNVDGDLPARYRVSGEAGSYSEALQIAASGQTNNLTQPGSTPYATYRASNADASVSGKKDAHKYGASYRYAGFVSEQLRHSQSDYFPTSYFTSQRERDTTRRDNRSDEHSFQGNYTYQTEKTLLVTSLTGAISNGSDFEELLQATDRDGAPLSATRRSSRSKSDSHTIRWQLSASRTLPNDNRLSLFGGLSYTDRQSRGLSYESRRSEEGTTLLDQSTFAPAPDRNFWGELSYGFSLGDAGNLSFSAAANYTGWTKRRLVTDRLTGAVDAARSENALDNTTTWSPKASYFLQHGRHQLSAMFEYVLEQRDYADRQRNIAYDRLFHHLTGALRYTLRQARSSFDVYASTMYKPLWAQDFSSRIDDTAPLNLKAGNPLLRPEKTHDLRLEFEQIHRSTSFGASLGCTLHDDPVIYRRTYFEQATPLPRYDDFEAPAGSTLRTPENGPKYLSAHASVKYKTRIAPLRLFFTAEGGYRYANPQTLLYDRSGRAHNHAADLEVGLTTNFSPQLRIGLHSVTSAQWERGLGIRSRLLNQHVKANLQWDITPGLFFATDYTWLHIASPTLGDTDSHLLNLSLGYRILKERGRIALNAYDLLNRYAAVTSSQSLQSVSYYWTRMGSNYFTVSFEFRFNIRQ